MSNGTPQITWDEPSTDEAPDIEGLSKKYGLDPEIIKKQIQQESGGKQSAVSSKGAIGLMQLMPETAERLGVDPHNPHQNVEGGMRDMSRLLKKYGGSYRMALAAYNAGENRVDEAKGIPNIPETQNYVKSIMGEEAKPQVVWDAPKGVEKVPQAPKPVEAPLTRGQAANVYLDRTNKFIANLRPRWDNPQAILQDPHWYGRSAKYFGGEAIGAGKAVAGAVTGGTKILNDLYSTLDPTEYAQRGTEPLKEVGRDIYGIGKMPLDLLSAGYDLLRHFPESSSDPEHLGNIIGQVAMTVDGGVKGAKAISEHLFPDAATMTKESIEKAGAKTAQQASAWSKVSPSAKAAHAASLASKEPIASKLRWNAVKSAYLHNNGVGIAKDFVKAEAEASKAVDADVAALSDNIPATEGIDAQQARQDILDAHSERVQTPDPLDSTLNQLVAEAKKLSPGQIPFEEARQFRSKIGQALRNSKGANKAVLSSAYQDLTKQLRGISKDYGLEDRWDHYNELERKRQISFPLLETAKDVAVNGSGVKMAQALKDETSAKEVIDSLSQYGLDAKKTIRYGRQSNKILREMPSENQRLTSYIYRVTPGTPFALGGLLLGKELASQAGVGGASWIAGLGLGAATGWAAMHVINVARALRLSPEVLDGILASRKWPGKIGPSEDIPEEPSAPTPKALPPAPTPQAPLPKVDKYSSQIMPDVTPTKEASLPTPSPQEIEDVRRETGLPLTEEAVARRIHERTDLPQKLEPKAKTEPKVTKLPPEAGSRVTKQRERVAKVRAEKGSTAYGGGTQEITGGGVAEEIAKTQERVNSPHLDVSNLQIPEMEEALRRIAPGDWKELQRLRKEGSLPDSEYQEGLRAFLLYAYEDQIQKAKE